MSLRLANLKDGRKAVIVRTSDRISFKKCRRSWSWSSHLKGNLGPAQLASPLWFGSAIHYGLEDLHGHNVFGRASHAFQAYCIATSKQHIRDLPADAHEHYQLGTAMLDYYQDEWLGNKDGFGRKMDKTYWMANPITGVMEPQVEVNFEIEVPLDEHPILKRLAEAQGADCVLYRGTIDRVCIDDEGNLWCNEYKTAKVAEHSHYQTDPQVTTYCWAMSHIYSLPVKGVIYQQFVKKMPAGPGFLSSGKISTSSMLGTSSLLYRKALVDFYGSVAAAPEANRKWLTDQMIKETPDVDRYIQREYIHRNAHMCDAEAIKILLEMEDMLNPDLPLYPNPTRECARMCSFLGACVSYDDGGDWENEINLRFSSRDQAADRLWRHRMPDPSVLHKIRDERMGTPDLMEMQNNLINMDPVERERIERGEESIAFTFSL